MAKLAALAVSVFIYSTSHAQTGPSLSPDILVYPRHAGKPDPRWRAFDWRFVDHSAHGAKYRLHFDADERWTARLALPLIDEQIAELSVRFGGSPEKTFDYILFTSLEEFSQANVFFVQEGVRGITSTEEATMALPYTGDIKEFVHVSKHELVHQFQTQKARSKSGSGNAVDIENVPLWFIEGMAEFESRPHPDPEMGFYLRDLLLYPDGKIKYSMPDFFESGPMAFAFVYKVGQAKLDFLERKFGSGTSQKIFDTALASDDDDDFKSIVSRALGVSSDEVARLWREDLDKTAKAQADQLPQGFESLEEVPSAGETLDLYDLAPDGNTLVIREVDPLGGVTKIQLMDAKGGSKFEVARDNRSDVAGLYFFQAPTFTLSNQDVWYFVQTPNGPALERRSYSRDGDKLRIGDKRRFDLKGLKLRGASHPVLNSDGSTLAFVGLHEDGWQSLQVMNVNSGELREILREPYAWRSLMWSKTSGGGDALMGATNRSAPDRFQLYRVSLESKTFERIGFSSEDQNSASLVRSSSGGDGAVVYQSTQSGSPQIHLLDKSGGETRLTGLKTMADRPILFGDTLYFLAFRSGRYRLMRLHRPQFLSVAVPTMDQAARTQASAATAPWTPKLAEIQDGDVKTYRPFATSGWRIDQIGAFLSGNTSGLVANASDLMRNYEVSTILVSPNNADSSIVEASFTNRRGRSTWTAGLFRTTQIRLDDLFASTDERRFFRHTEWGAIGAFEYPLALFSKVGIGGRISAVQREPLNDGDFPSSGGNGTSEARAREGTDTAISPAIWFGHDRVLYEPLTGPIGGMSLLAEAGTAYYPKARTSNHRLRLDLASYWPLFSSRTVFSLEGVAGASFGGPDRESFFVWSDDILRAYPYGDRRLLGNYVAAAKAEVRFPVGSLFNFPNLRGLAAFDYGTVTRDWSQANENISSSLSYGGSLSFPPLAIEIVRTHPQKVAPGREIDSGITHVRLQYLYE